MPASDPLLLQAFPGGSLVVATGVASFASAYGLYRLAHRHGRWWALAGMLVALTTNALALTTLQAVAFSR